jgi:HAE1 family hydrophobic/amphiphilic exporter-1
VSDAAPRRAGAIAFTIARPVATTMVTVAVATFGFISLTRIPLELLPAISYPSITVRTEYEGAGPEDVEERVSRRVEEALAVIPGLVAHSSVSRAGLSDVLLEFQWDKTLTLATQEIRERLDRASLPDDVTAPLVLRYDPALDPVLRIALSGDRDLAELRLAADEIVARGLATVTGVAAVKIRGGLETEIRVRLDNRKLSQLNLDISEVDRKLKIENVNLASGSLIEGDTEYLVRTLNEFQDLDEILDLGIASRGGRPVRLRELATVERTAKERDVVTRVDGQESVELLVYREADANIVDLATQVRVRLLGDPVERAWLDSIESGAIEDPERKLAAALRAAEDAPAAPGAGDGRDADEARGDTRSRESPEIHALRAEVARKKAAEDYLAARLPRGVEARILSDQSIFIVNAIDEVKGAALLGGVLSIVVLLLFLRDLGATSIISVAIPLSVVATFACMFGSGTTLNIMSLGGLALGIGMLVDNSIVVLESIVRCREEGDDQMASAQRGAAEVGLAVMASTATTIAVFFPITFVTGVAGQIFRDQALTVVYSLVSSLFVALFFVPMLAARTAGARGVRMTPRQAFAQPRRFLASLLLPVALPSRLLGVADLRASFRKSNLRGALLLPLMIVRIALEWASRIALAAVALLLYAVVVIAYAVVRLLAFLATPLRIAFDHGFAVVQKSYPPLLRATIATPLRCGVLLALAAIAGYGSSQLRGELGSEMLPTVHQGEIVVAVEFPVGTPVERTADELVAIERKLAAIEGVATASSSTGVARDEVAGVDEGTHSARILLRLVTAGAVMPSDDRRALEDRVIESAREVLAARADITAFRFSRPTLFSLKSPLQIEVKGTDLVELRAVAATLVDRLGAIPGLSDVKTSAGRGNPEIRLTLDREKMLRFGLDMEAISNRIRAQVQGVVSTRFSEGERRIDVRVASDVESVAALLDLTVNRGRAVDLADTLDRGGGGGGGSATASSNDRTFFPGTTIDLGSGAAIPLRQVANVTIVEGPAEIRRVGGQRAVIVTANTTGFDVGGALDRIRGQLVDLEIENPGVQCSIGGQGAEMDSALDQMFNAILLAVFLVYLVMASQFESILQPLLIMLAIPLALVGADLAMFATATPISVVALIGAIVLAGIVVNNAIVLVDYTNQLRARGRSLQDALIEAGATRLRPILMTTLTTVLGLVPLTGALEAIPGIEHLPALLWAGSELQRPLAIVVIGGLSLSTLLTLFVIPALYRLVEGAREAVRARRAA